MNTPSSTYTMLVTISHDDGAAPSTELLEVMIQRGLEEGVREFAGVYSAQVSALPGERLDLQRGAMDERERVGKAIRLHRSLRA